MAGRILIVDDVAAQRTMLRAKLAAAFYDVTAAASGEEALARLADGPPDLVLLDVRMPGLDGFDVCRRLKAAPETAHIPVVFLTSLGDEASLLEAFAAGADDFLSKPIDDRELFARVRSLMRVKGMVDELRIRDETRADLGAPTPIERRMEVARPRVLMLHRDVEAGEMAAEEIGALLPHARFMVAATPSEAMEIIKDARPDAAVVNLERDQPARLRFVAALRSDPSTRRAATLLLTPPGAGELAAHGLDLGATDYAEIPTSASVLAARLRVHLGRKLYADQLRDQLIDGLRLAATDPLTGLCNRRYVDAHLPRMTRRAAHDRSALAILMLDLDHFKSINDTWGHAAGDAVLKEFATRLEANMRSIDLVARTGGEEFLVAMPDAGIEAAMNAAERIRGAVADARFPVGDGSEIDVTVSVGVAALTEIDTGPDTLLGRADDALYASKHAGRNRVSLAA